MPLLTSQPSKLIGRRTAWYRAGGAPAPVAIYQPKGAASLAASYVNLVNPGTNNAAPGAAPTWDATNGWIFDGLSQYLTTGLTPANNQSWSVVVRFSGGTATDRFLLGSSGGAGARFRIKRSDAGSKATYANGGGDTAGSAAAVSAGVLCVAGASGYLNGAQDLASISAWTDVGLAIYIGASNNGGTAGGFFSGNLQALAIYNSALTAGQVAAVSAAMAAL